MGAAKQHTAALAVVAWRCLKRSEKAVSRGVAMTTGRISIAAVTGLRGCSGVARLGIFIKCDRLYIGGVQMRAAAVRDANGVYSCANQVIDGAHVGAA